jgi:hypothetical protein
MVSAVIMNFGATLTAISALTEALARDRRHLPVCDDELAGSCTRRLHAVKFYSTAQPTGTSRAVHSVLAPHGLCTVMYGVDGFCSSTSLCCCCTLDQHNVYST